MSAGVAAGDCTSSADVACGNGAGAEPEGGKAMLLESVEGNVGTGGMGICDGLDASSAGGGVGAG